MIERLTYNLCSRTNLKRIRYLRRRARACLMCVCVCVCVCVYVCVCVCVCVSLSLSLSLCRPSPPPTPTPTHTHTHTHTHKQKNKTPTTKNKDPPPPPPKPPLGTVPVDTPWGVGRREERFYSVTTTAFSHPFVTRTLSNFLPRQSTACACVADPVFNIGHQPLSELLARGEECMYVGQPTGRAGASPPQSACLCRSPLVLIVAVDL